MLSDEWLSRYGLLENFNASVTRTRTGTRTGTGTWTTGVTAIALCTSCSRAKKSRKISNFFNLIVFQFFHLRKILILYIACICVFLIYEPRHEKTGFLPRRKQRRRSASHCEADQRLCFRNTDSTISLSS